MQKSKIEWTDYVWNPIKGLCPVGCWYCYARKIYKRFKKDEEPRLANEEEFFSPVNSWKTRREKARIFACSTFDLFHPIADKWRGQIFQVIEMDRADTFIILTKLPHLIDRPMPDNVWLGVSVTQQEEAVRKSGLMKHEAKIRFISYEPMLGELDPAILYGLDWAILGRLTGHGKKHDPEPELIEAFVDDARQLTIPVFLKNNLREIWGEPLIQEFPE